MKTVKFLTVILAAVIYRHILTDISFNLAGVNLSYAVYICREIIGYALMFQIVPSVIIKVWDKKFKEVI